MALEIRAWTNFQSYATTSSVAGMAREASYFTPLPETVTVDPDHVRSEARQYEADGYDASVVPQSATWPDGAATAAWALAATTRLGVVHAHRPGVQAPTAAARSLATLDRLSQGRAGVHVILGHADRSRDGDLLDRGRRHARAAEYLEIYTRTLISAEPFDFAGEFHRVEGAYSGVRPVTSPRPVISLPGGSERDVELAVRYADVLALHGRPLPETAASVAAAEAVAVQSGRSLRYWVNLNVVLGESDAAAWDHLRALEAAISALKAHRGTPVAEDPDVGDQVADQVADQALYLGFSRRGDARATLVGSPATVADALLAYHDAGVGILTVGGLVTTREDRELRTELIRLTRQGALAREALGRR